MAPHIDGMIGCSGAIRRSQWPPSINLSIAEGLTLTCSTGSFGLAAILLLIMLTIKGGLNYVSIDGIVLWSLGES